MVLRAVILSLVLQLALAGVSQLDPIIFQKIQDSKEAALVYYYASPLGGEVNEMDAKATQILDQLDERLGAYGIHIGKMNCSVKLNKKACSAVMMRGVPSFVFYVDAPKPNPYTRKLFREGIVLELQNGVDARSVERFVGKAFPDEVTRVTSLQQLEQHYASASLVLFTEKDVVSMLLKSVAFSVNSSLSVFQATGVTFEDIRGKFPQLLSEAGQEDSLPVLALISDNNAVRFKGDLKRQAMMDWISSNHLFSEKEIPHAETESGGDTSSSFASSGTASRQYRDPVTGDAIKSFSSADVTSMDVFHDETVWIVAVVAGVSGENNKVSIGEGWEKLISWCEGVVKPAIIYCSATPTQREDSFGHKVCQRQLPFIAVLGHGSSGRKKILANPTSGPHVFDLGDESLEGIKRRALETLPDTSVFVIPEQGIQEFVQASQNREVMSVVILSGKSSIPPMLRNLALSMSKFSSIAFLQSPSADFMSNIGNPKLPTAIAMFVAAEQQQQQQQNQANIQIVVYDGNNFGPLRFATLQAFIFQAFSRTSYAEKLTKSESNGAASISGDIQKEVVWVTNETEWAEQCGSSFRGICAVGLLRGSKEEEADDGTVMQKGMVELGRAGAAFRFIAVDGKCQGAFATRFDAEMDHLPALAAYSPNKGRYALFKGSFTPETIKDFLSNILSGKIGTNSTPQRPSLASDCDSPTVGGGEVFESDQLKADAVDLMEEIRREEAEKKAQLKKEIEEEQRQKKVEVDKGVKKIKKVKKVKKKKKKAQKVEL